MSAEAFLLFALAVIYCAISFPGIAGQTRARPRRQHSSVDRASREAPRYFKCHGKREKR
jgi:hypothetical protein